MDRTAVTLFALLNGDDIHATFDELGTSLLLSGLPWTQVGNPFVLIVPLSDLLPYPLGLAAIFIYVCTVVYNGGVEYIHLHHRRRVPLGQSRTHSPTLRAL